MWKQKTPTNHHTDSKKEILWKKLYSKKESDLRTQRDPFKETTQNSLKIFYSILFLCQTPKTKSFNQDLGFYFPLVLDQGRKTPSPREKRNQKKFFLSSFTIFSLCILFCSLSPFFSLIHAEGTGVGDTQPEPLTFLRTNQTVPTTTLTKNSQIRKVERAWENDRKKEKKESGVCFLMLERKSHLTLMGLCCLVLFCLCCASVPLLINYPSRLGNCVNACACVCEKGF